jgi:pyruvate, water dikinase
MLAHQISNGAKISQDTLVLPLKDTRREDLALVGGKGASLGEMTRAGFPVPPGFIVTTPAYENFIANNRVDEVIEGLLAGLDIEDSAALARAAQQIQSVIFSSPLPPKVQEAIEEGYEHLGKGPVAVRSSATAEDLPQASFSGQQSTFLYVEGTEEVLRAVRACWASLYEARAIFYREDGGLNHREVDIAVAVQRMVDAEVSGVLFTADPNTDRRDRMVVEAIYGLGEPLVSGQLSPDLAVIAKATLQVISHQTATQPWALLHSRNGHGFWRGTARYEIPAAQQSLPKLSGEAVRELALLGLKIEQHYGCPQDIEWVLAQGRVYIVQSRPVTTLERDRFAS